MCRRERGGKRILWQLVSDEVLIGSLLGCLHFRQCKPSPTDSLTRWTLCVGGCWWLREGPLQGAQAMLTELFPKLEEVHGPMTDE